MILKEQIIDWFKEQEAHQRLDLVCCLLNHSLPFENRFIEIYIKTLMKRDSFSLQDLEIITLLDKNPCPWDSESASLSDETVRQQMILTLAFLQADRRLEARLIFKVLQNPHTQEWLRNFRKQNKSSADCNNIYYELLLIYVMALYHPVFTFEEQARFSESYKLVKNSILPLDDVDQQVSSQQTNSAVTVKHSTSPKTCAGAESESRPRSVSSTDSSRSVRNGLKNLDLSSVSSRGNQSHRNVPVSSSGGKQLSSPRDEAPSSHLETPHSPRSVDQLIRQLQDRAAGKESSTLHSDICRTLAKYSLSDMYSISDSHLKKLGLSPFLISHFRQILNESSHNVQQSSEQGSSPSGSRLSGSSTPTDPYSVQFPPLRQPESLTSTKASTRSHSPAGRGTESLDVAEIPVEPSVQETTSSRANNSGIPAPPVNFPGGGGGNFSAFPFSVQQQRSSTQHPELPYVPLAMSFTVPQASNSFYVATNTPPGGLDANVPLLACQNFLPVEAVTGASEGQQPPFAFAPAAAGLPPATSPGVAFSFPANMVMHGRYLAQPLRRPNSVMEMAPFVSPCTFVFSPADLDVTRPPPQPQPQTLTRPVSCYNCGRTGHRGDECAELAGPAQDEPRATPT